MKTRNQGKDFEFEIGTKVLLSNDITMIIDEIFCAGGFVLLYGHNVKATRGDPTVTAIPEDIRRII